MKIFYITLLSVFILTLLSRLLNSKKEIVNGDITVSYNNPNILLVFFAVSILILVSGLRSGIGDTPYYRLIFNNLPNNFNVYSLNISSNNEWGFDVFQIFIKAFITNDSQIYLLICAIITNGLIAIVLYRYCKPIELGFFLYITAGNYLVTMNGIRQYLVSAVLYFFVFLIVKNKWYLYILIVLLLSTIHQSVLVFIPLFFLVRIKAWSKATWYMVGFSIMLLISFTYGSELFISILQDTRYGYYGSMLSESGHGANIIRVMVSAVPVILSYIYRKELAVKGSIYDISTNFSILNLIIMALSVNNWIFARFSMYFSLYIMLLLPHCISVIKDKKNNTILYLPFIILFFVYYYYEMEISLGVIYKSNILGV